jgi:hypothetical protein
VILHIIPTITRDFQRDYVMLVPAEVNETAECALDYMEACRVTPAVIERDVAFAGLSQFRRMYQDIVVHTMPF